MAGTAGIGRSRCLGKIVSLSRTGLPGDAGWSPTPSASRALRSHSAGHGSILIDMRRRFDSSPERPGHESRTVRAIDDEFRVLTTEAGRRLARRGRHDPVDPARRTWPGSGRWPRRAVSAAVRLSQARRKAAEKFERGERMWVEPTGVEQATAEPVARHKATRFRRLPARRRSLRRDRRRRDGAGRARSGLWRSTSIRGCAAGSAGMPRSTRSPIACWRSGPGGDVRDPRRRLGPSRPGPPGRSRPPRSSARGLRARARRSGSRSFEQVPGGAIKLGPAADFARHFPPGRGTRSS